MAFSVMELLKAEELNKVKLLSGEKGLNNEIKGVTIIEAPDIVKFINGGEVLLTGLYAFKSSTVEEFSSYLNELTRKNVSALMLKRGREVDFADTKIQLLLEFSEQHEIPLLEVPFDVSFRDILALIMEHLFNEEVTRLKFFKTTYDIFTPMVLSTDSSTRKIEKILKALQNFIQNPVALFDQHMDCLAASKDAPSEFAIQDDAVPFEPDYYSNYSYLRQNNVHTQYIVQIKLNFRERIYLVVTEMYQPFKIMDCIAIENAIVSLRLEYSMQSAVIDLEEKFENDIMHNLLNGKVHSMEELQKNTTLLNVPINGSYRVIVFGMTGNMHDDDFSAKVKDTSVLSVAVSAVLRRAKVQNDQDKVVVIHQVDRTQTQEEYRSIIKDALKDIQREVSKYNKRLKIKAGVGRSVDGIINIPESFREANEAFTFVDVAGELEEGQDSQAVLFSDLGIFKLLCKIEDPAALMEYVPEGLQKLYNYKKPQRDDLIVTLKTYLERNQNLSKTAQDLYVHYKTAAYRIEKISKITGFDFNNANEMLAVRIGLVVYKMIENYTKDTI